MSWEAGVAAGGVGSASAMSRGALLQTGWPQSGAHPPKQNQKIAQDSSDVGPHLEGIVMERPSAAGVAGNLCIFERLLLIGMSVSCRADLPNLLLG